MNPLIHKLKSDSARYVDDDNNQNFFLNAICWSSINTCVLWSRSENSCWFFKNNDPVAVHPIQSALLVSRPLQWVRVIRHSLVGCMLDLMWLFGLTMVGPFRFILLFEHGEAIVIAGAAALYSGSSGPTKVCARIPWDLVFNWRRPCCRHVILPIILEIPIFDRQSLIKGPFENEV